MSESGTPPALPGGGAAETHETVEAEDGTRLFLRTMQVRPARSRSRETASPEQSGAGVRAFFCDGILCDGFIWKYLWNDLAGVCDVAHWHYRGQRSLG